MIKKICDVCGEEATNSMELKLEGMTPLIKDLCPRHFDKIKKFMNKLLNGIEEEA